VFPVDFKPSPRAIARFLEHRRIQPTEEEREAVYSEAARPRRVVGLLPLDNHGVPAPPPMGRVFATLPTEVSLPFGLHINADWLLNMSRTGLRDVEADPWQQEIVDRIADVLTSFLRWVSRRCTDPDAAQAAFATLQLPSADGESRLEALLAEGRWLRLLGSQLSDSSVFPVWTAQHGTLGFAGANETIFPPEALAEAFESTPALRPADLLHGPVLATEVLGSGARRLLTASGLIQDMTPQDLERTWKGGLEDWWEKLSADLSRQRDLLYILWGAVADLPADDDWPSIELACVRMERGTWLPVNQASYYNEALPNQSEPGGHEISGFIESRLPATGLCLPFAWIA